MFKIPEGEKQPRYQLYMDAHGLKSGDTHKHFAFRGWINKHAPAFREKHGLGRWDCFAAHNLQDEFTEYLKKCAEYEKEIAQGQTDIFDFLGG